MAGAGLVSNVLKSASVQSHPCWVVYVVVGNTVGKFCIARRIQWPDLDD